MADGDLYLIPTDPDTPFPLGRAGVWHDPRNRNFRAAGTPRTATARTRPWASSVVTDQGAMPSCTVHAANGMLNTQPHRTLLKVAIAAYDTEPERAALYYEAQKNDPWPGEAYSGSSGDAPLKVMRARGEIQEWRWLFGIDEVRSHLQFVGPVSVGTVWLADMFTPVGGTIKATGAEAGGHQYRIVYYDAVNRRYRIVNSWGRGWSEEGRAWISEDDLASLLGQQGDAVVIV